MMGLLKRNRVPGGPSDRQRSASLLVIMAVGGFVLFLQWRWLGDHQHLFAPFSLERISCETCGKTGKVPKEGANNVLEMCPVCFGVGSHTVRRMDQRDVLCAACMGLGRLEDKEGHWRTCQRCDGRGLIQSGAEFEEEAEHSTSNEESQPSTLDVGR